MATIPAAARACARKWTNRSRSRPLRRGAGPSPPNDEARPAVEIDAIGEDRRKLNQALLDTAARLRTVESRIAETEARLARQWSDDEKRKYADYVIDTSVSFNESRLQTVKVYNQLRGL